MTRTIIDSGEVLISTTDTKIYHDHCSPDWDKKNDDELYIIHSSATNHYVDPWGGGNSGMLAGVDKNSAKVFFYRFYDSNYTKGRALRKVCG